MTIAATTTTGGATSVTVTPTGGSTQTLELYRTQASNKNQFVFAEDTGGAYKATVTVSAQASVQKTNADGTLSFEQGVTQLTMTDYVANGGVYYPVIRGYRFTLNEFKVTKAEMLSFLIKDTVFLAKACVIEAIWNRKIA